MTASTIEDFQNFLQRKTVTSVYLNGHNGYALNDLDYNKAGLLPFFIDEIGVPHFYLAKLARTDPARSEPLFQIPKGTRERWWFDETTGDHRSEIIKDNDAGKAVDGLETLAVTALREAEEEAGLDRHNIRKLFDLGPVSFESESSPGKHKKMWLFAAEINDRNKFSAPAGVAVNSEGKISASTERCGWFRLDKKGHLFPDDKEEKVGARKDHVELIRTFAAKLRDKQHVFRDNVPAKTLLTR